jgi:hypothetical protein
MLILCAANTATLSIVLHISYSQSSRLPHFPRQSVTILSPKLRIYFADFPHLDCYIGLLLTLETSSGYATSTTSTTDRRCYLPNHSPPCHALSTHAQWHKKLATLQPVDLVLGLPPVVRSQKGVRGRGVGDWATREGAMLQPSVHIHTLPATLAEEARGAPRQLPAGNRCNSCANTLAYAEALRFLTAFGLRFCRCGQEERRAHALCRGVVTTRKIWR